MLALAMVGSPGPRGSRKRYSEAVRPRCEICETKARSEQLRWTLEPAFNEPPPECWGGIASRDNHNGNVRNGHPDYYLWKIPEHIKGRVVLRIRYNITTDDFTLGSLANPTEEGTSLSGIKADPFFMDRSFNDPNPNNRRRGHHAGRFMLPLLIARSNSNAQQVIF